MPTIIDGSGSATFQTPLPLLQGGTGAATAAAARTSLDVTYPAYGRVVRTAGNITTTSTSPVDVTGATVTLTTGAFPVAYGASQTIGSNVTGGAVFINTQVDGVNELGTAGMVTQIWEAGRNANGSYSGQSAALTAAAHTIKERWHVGSGTGTIAAASDLAHMFYAHEVR